MCIRDRLNPRDVKLRLAREPVSYTHLDVYKRQALSSEVLGLAARAGVAEARMQLAIHSEGGGHDRAGTDQLTFAPGLFHHHAEALSLIHI